LTNNWVEEDDLITCNNTSDKKALHPPYFFEDFSLVSKSLDAAKVFAIRWVGGEGVGKYDF
jgi:hypothetical protein